MGWSLRKTVHEVAFGSNLDLILRGFNGAVNRAADEIGDGLHAIALALSTKEDNSAEIKSITEKVRAQRVTLKTAIDNQIKGE